MRIKLVSIARTLGLFAMGAGAVEYLQTGQYASMLLVLVAYAVWLTFHIDA